MCISVAENYVKPDDGVIRYKTLHRNYAKDEETGKRNYVSQYKSKEYTLGKTYRKQNKSENVNELGLHVFVNLSDAKFQQVFYNDVVVECRCKGFVAGGNWENSYIKNEIWRQITIVREVK